MIFKGHRSGAFTYTAHDLPAVARDLGGAMIDNAVLYKLALIVLGVTAAKRIIRMVS